MGKKVIPIQPIKDTRQRQVTFSKRKSGIFKKAAELAILTGVDIILEIGSNGRVYRFQSDDDYEKLRAMLDSWNVQGTVVTPHKLALEGKLKGATIDETLSDETRAAKFTHSASGKMATRSTRSTGDEVSSAGGSTGTTTTTKSRGSRGPVSTVRYDPETVVRRPAALASHFPTSAAAGQMPMMFYNPYMQYPMMAGQNFPMQGFLPPHPMMMSSADMASSQQDGSAGSVAMRRLAQQRSAATSHPTDRSKSGASAEGRGAGDDDEATDYMNLAVHAAQEQQRMMNQWAAASNYSSTGGPPMTGDEYLRAPDEYTSNMSSTSGAGVPMMPAPFYTGPTGGPNTMPSSGYLGATSNWPSGVGGTGTGSSNSAGAGNVTSQQQQQQQQQAPPSLQRGGPRESSA